MVSNYKEAKKAIVNHKVKVNGNIIFVPDTIIYSDDSIEMKNDIG
ncbi:MAG: hypothetical protein WDA59_07260 [Methanofastidiosum sp.]